ncbi:MAG: alginate export family protein [Treponemataceae bacterium]
MKRKFSVATLILAAILTAAAQTPFLEEDFFLPVPQKAPWLLDWGVTLSLAGLFEHQGDSDTLVTGLSGNAWVRLSLPGQWQYYARIRDNLLTSVLPWPTEGVELLNVWEINANYFQLILPEGGVTFSIGRKPFLLGSALILAGNGDGLELQLANPWFNAKMFGFYTGLINPAFSSYAMNDEDQVNGAKRYFGAYSLGIWIFGHELSLLGMYQNDFNNASEELYASWYSGLQAKGLLVGGEYLLEWYLQRGYSPSGLTRGNIEAFGGTCRYQRTFKAVTTPRITIQYWLASGDPDRTVGKGAFGNAEGTDSAFQAFGQLNLGLAFRPHLSNLHVAQLGVIFNPLEILSRQAPDLNVSFKYFYYAKHEADGVVNVDEGNLSSNDLGHGVDLGIQWAPFDDVSVFLNAGLFLPGAAFSGDRALRYAVSGGMSLSL